MTKEHSVFGQFFFGCNPSRTEREEKVLQYIIHRIDEDADLHDVLQEPYVQRNCSQTEIDETAQRFIEEASNAGEIHIVAHRRRGRDDPEEYARKEKEQREDNHIPEDEPIIFLEVAVEDASEFEDVLEVSGVEIDGHKVLRAKSSVVPNAIAAFLLHLRDAYGKAPHCYFGWTEGNPIVYLFRFLLFGEGDTAPVTHEVLREAERDLEQRPAVHVGGR